MDGPIPFAAGSYLESLRELAQFIRDICRLKLSLEFAWINSIFTSIAAIIHRLPAGSPVNITDTVRLICTHQAEEAAKAILAGCALATKTEIEQINRSDFPFDGSVKASCVDVAILRFEAQCKAFSPELLDEIPEKAAMLRRDIRDQWLAEWQR
jgi:hypothetical protein